MPEVRHYNPPFWLRNGHVQTLWPALFRRIDDVDPVRERLATEDDDFLDLDWYRGGNDRLLVISHGLEGSSRRPYVMGLARAALRAGWDALAWNFRSCSGEMNLQPRFYHSGATVDLDAVARRALADAAAYRTLALAGFSMGGNLTLVYMGQQGNRLDSRIAGGVTFSVPCDLAASAACLARPWNRLYMSKFMRELRRKMRAKHRRFPEIISLVGLNEIRTFREFDDRYTAPLHGFENAEDYWSRCSSGRFLSNIKAPVLILNALDDPFLADGCYPYDQVRRLPHITLETPRRGGHVGFVSTRRDGLYWSEQRALQFLAERI